MSEEINPTGVPDQRSQAPQPSQEQLEYWKKDLDLKKENIRHSDLNRKISTTALLVSSMSVIMVVFNIYHTWQKEDPHAADVFQSQLYPMDEQLSLYLGHFPHAFAAFDHDPSGSIYTNLDEANKAVCTTACDAAGDMFEYYLINQDPIKQYPHDADIRNCWDRYFESVCTNNFAFRSRIMGASNVWSKIFIKKFIEYSDNKTYQMENGSTAIIHR